MGFGISLHLRAIDTNDRSHVLIVGVDEDRCLVIRENGDLQFADLWQLQVEMHYNAEADAWRDDFGEDDGPAIPWDEADEDGDQEATDGDPELQGSDHEDQGAGDSDPPGGSAGDVDPGS